MIKFFKISILCLVSFCTAVLFASCGSSPSPSPTGTYTITWKNDDGSILANEDYKYGEMPSYKGETPTKPSTSQYSYTFSSWTPALEKVSCNKTYTATFTRTLFKYDVKWYNGITVLETDSVEYGKTPSYTGSTPVRPQDAQYIYTFSGWDKPITPVFGPQTYTAQFNKTPKEYTVTVTSEDTNKGTVSGGGTYAYNSSVTIKAIPQTGYSFEGWYKDGERLPSTSSSYTFTMPANNVSYLAKFKVNQYIVTVTSEDTSKGTVSGGGTYVYGSNVTIKAIPQTGYSFEGWYKDGKKVSLPNPYTFKMPAGGVSYEARFIVNTYTVTVTSEDTSKGIVKGGGTFAYNSNVVITATPKENYSFEGWYKDGEKLPSAPALYGFTMPANNVNYEARFTANPYTVTVTSEDESKGTVSGSGTYACGSKVTIKATPNAGYKFNGWYDGETHISNESIYNFNMPAKDIAYTAKFANENAWFFKKDWWNYCSNGVDEEQATEKDIGQEVELTVNEQVHKVRLIDINHDELNDGSGNKAHCTFEFSNLLSDSNGYSLAAFWDTTHGKASTNYDYLNSDLRKALDGQGNGTLRWYQKDSPTKSTTYNTSVYDMLPSSLKDNIKTVKKYVATTDSYVVNNYDTKVFALTFREMTQDPSDLAEEEGTTYKYHKDHDNSSSRIKHQIKWHDGAAPDSTKITDTDITWNAYNYAGFNSSTEENHGGHYWLSSPCADSWSNAWQVFSDGDYDNPYYYLYQVTYAVAPAFCI